MIITDLYLLYNPNSTIYTPTYVNNIMLHVYMYGQELSGDIERDLNDLADCITNMRNCAGTSSTTASHQEVLIKRYHEIHFDYNAEFRNTSMAVTRKRESMELFKSSKKGNSNEQDSSVQKLLKERNSIAASMKSINDVIRYFVVY